MLRQNLLRCSEELKSIMNYLNIGIMVHAFRQSLQDALHECTQKVSMKRSYKELVDSRNHAELH